ncbi:hypothetical protein KAU33_12880 [Candidatus Dependentiae bacterium]|nr:hypothetical protein [Candidatus Dependentiae bacterium]
MTKKSNGKGDAHGEVHVPSKYPPSTTQVPPKLKDELEFVLNMENVTWDSFMKFVPSMSQVCPKPVSCYELARIILVAQTMIGIKHLVNKISMYEV